MDPAIISAWWDRWPEANLGVAAGADLLVVDVDGADAHSRLDALAAEHGSLPTTRAVRTGRDGGSHLWFRIPSGSGLGNSSGRLATGLDTRGDGGYVLAPPSLHASGRHYAWDSRAQIAPAPEWLLARLRESGDANGRARSANGHGPVGKTTDDDQHRRRVAAYGAAVLERELADLKARSTEPGTGRGTALFGSATRLGTIIAAGGLPLTATWQALLEAGGQLGLPIEERDRNVERGLDLGLRQPRELPDRTAPAQPNGSPPPASSAADSGEDPWPEMPAGALPGFPVDALPYDIARFVEAIALETQTPADLAAIGVLGTLSAAALGAAVVDCGAWEEELSLYLLAVMESGDHKSAVLRSVVAPLYAIERERREGAQAGVRDATTRQEALGARKRKLIAKFAELDEPEDRRVAEAELADVALQIEAIGEPAMPRLLADDATPEALAGLLTRHGQIAVIAAEAPLIDNLIGRYSAEGAANLHLVCHAFNGEATLVDRRGRDPERLERPLMTIALTVQPHVLRKVIEHELARAQGLVGRFAYAIPESRLGSRRIDPPRASRQLHAAWAVVVRRVYSRNPLTEQTQTLSVGSVSNSESEIQTLSLSPPAKKLLDKLRTEQEPRLADSGDLRPVADWIARHPGRVARIAGLLHLVEHPAASPISEATMRDALRIGEYLLAHSVAALTTPDAITRRALRWLSDHPRDTVTQRDLHRGPLGGRGSAEKAGGLAQALVAAGALRRVPADESTGPGRPPSPTWQVNRNLRTIR